MTTFALDGMDLAALLCSRVCHDVISPVGAIINGLEVLEDEKEGEMREIALDLIKKSAAAASARLQFCRLAYGAAGSVGASIDTGDAEKVTRALIANDRTKLVWNGAGQYAPKNKVKLVLNLCLIAAAIIPRGGIITVNLTGEGDGLEAEVEANGANPALSFAGYGRGGRVEIVRVRLRHDLVGLRRFDLRCGGRCGRRRSWLVRRACRERYWLRLCRVR